MDSDNTLIICCALTMGAIALMTIVAVYFSHRANKLKFDQLTELNKDLLRFTEKNGDVVNGFRTRDIIHSIKKIVK